MTYFFCLNLTLNGSLTKSGAKTVPGSDMVPGSDETQTRDPLVCQQVDTNRRTCWIYNLCGSKWIYKNQINIIDPYADL